jgi:hypothetical protein
LLIQIQLETLVIAVDTDTLIIAVEPRTGFLETDQPAAGILQTRQEVEILEE